eukprot:9629-Pelagococcus_subviridis.AAC.11
MARKRRALWSSAGGDDHGRGPPARESDRPRVLLPVRDAAVQDPGRERRGGAGARRREGIRSRQRRRRGRSTARDDDRDRARRPDRRGRGPERDAHADHQARPRLEISRTSGVDGDARPPLALLPPVPARADPVHPLVVSTNNRARRPNRRVVAEART